MKRREFLRSTAALAALSAATTMDAAENPHPTGHEFYELRIYHLRKGPKQKLMDDYYREASIPAMKRLGIGPVGVFNVLIGPDSPTTYVLIPHVSLETFVTTSDRIQSDPEY